MSRVSRCLSRLWLILSPLLATSTQAASLKIAVDDPQFSPLRLAIPTPQWPLEVAKQRHEWLNAFADLATLFRLSGYYHVVDPRAVAFLETQFRDRAASRIERLDRSGWRTRGLDAAVLTQLTPSGGGEITLRLSYLDLSQGGPITAEQRIASANDLRALQRRFVDQVLQNLTGRPGLFSSKVVFVGRRNANDHKQIYQCNVDGSELEQLSTAAALHVAPAWHPDGSRIVYTSYESGNPDLYLLELKTRQKRLISRRKGLSLGGRFSPSGTHVVFAGTREGDTDIFISSLTQPSPSYLLISGRGLDVNPSFSPDGTWLAFVSGRYTNPHIFRARVTWDGPGGLPQVTSDERLTFAGWYNVSPAWSPDSQKIAYASFDREIGRFDLFLMNADGSKLERLTRASGNNEEPAWSPNGQLITFSSDRRQSKRPELYVMRRDGSGQQRIGLPLYSAESPNWSRPVLAPPS